MSDSRKKRYGAGGKSRSDASENSHRQHSGSNSANHGRRNNNHSGMNFQRLNSYDRVRKIVQEEGRAARNLITWNVPVVQQERTGRSKIRQSRKPLAQRHSPTAATKYKEKSSDEEYQLKSPPETPKSPKCDGQKTKVDLRARYWAFLFDNLKRAVDAIYQTCEEDESDVECKEVIMMLDQSTKDFRSLIERLHIMRAYEDATRGGDRPTSIAWEVRKMSPGKNTSHSPMQERSSPSPAKRNLNFGSPPQQQEPSKQGNSWADRVKGTCSGPSGSPVPNHKELELTIDIQDDGVDLLTEEEDGWETVQRGGKSRTKPPVTRKPCDNKTDNIKSQKNKNGKQMSGKPESNHTELSRDKPDIQQPDLSSNSHSSLKRTSSKDSEKENRPLEVFEDKTNNNEEYSSGQNINIMNSVASKIQNSVITSDPVPNEKTEKTGDIDGEQKCPGRDIEQGISRHSTAVLCANACAENNVADHYNSLINHDYDKEDDDDMDDRLTQHAQHLDKALASAEDEEDSLTERLEEEQEKAIQTAIRQEETWLEELAREESKEIEVEAESESDLGVSQTTISSLDTSTPSVDWDTLVANFDADEEKLHDTSWGDIVEREEAESGRTPGHGVHMHEKLSSPSRKRSLTESRKRHEAKQAKAQELREKLLTEKAERLRDLSKKVEEVRAWKDELLRQRKQTIEMKMLRAEEKRQSQLKLKAQKAHEEEAKEERMRRMEEKQAKEAAVEERRKALEAERTARLMEMQERRKLRNARVEQQQQEREKERQEAFRNKEREKQERLAALSAQQQAHIEELQKKIQQKQDETHRRHIEMLEGIQKKAFEMSVLRHSTEDHNDAPRLIPYDQKKLCTVCNVLITSEVYLLSHLRGKKHRQVLEESNLGQTPSRQEIEMFNLKNIVDAPDNSNHPKLVGEKERQKALKKRCKKLRQRMSSRGQEYESSLSGKQSPVESQHKAKLQKLVKDVNKYLQCPDTGPWPQNRVTALDRALGEIIRILDKKVQGDQITFCRLGGLTSLCRLLMLLNRSNASLPPVIPPKSLVLVCNAFKFSCKGCYDNCHYMLFSNKVGTLVDLLIHQLSVMLPENVTMSTACGEEGSSRLSTKLPYDPVVSNLMFALSTILSCLAKNNPTFNCSEAAAERTSNSGDAFMSRGNDVISYVISVGIVDKLTQYLNSVHGPIDEERDIAEFLQHSLGLLVAITKFTSKRNSSPFDQKKEDPTQLINTFEVTDLVGIVSLLYGMLLHSGAPARGEAAPPDLPQHTIAVTTIGIRMLNHMAMLDLPMLQKTLGAEGLSLEFRHIASYLIWFCSEKSSEELLHEVILCVGYFTALHPDNQVIIQSGQPPTVLQQMCALPFQYFSDPRLTAILFPTLISCCFNNQQNREILEQELSCSLLSNFIEEKQLELQQARLLPSTARKEKEKGRDMGEQRMLLSTRFPMDQWNAAQAYFNAQDTPP
ncbi:S phase cyclin A-associated protein in the endoplasmic reticulum-like isoform X2 [Liolophura sinensis]|uniref:S phase cyclin A-associated protein in the endoplasmic reticulum-like isoform X2 n=1 Tax=Liolophura sinensis TaxID=3198878 RepID=UPI003158A728